MIHVLNVIAVGAFFNWTVLKASCTRPNSSWQLNLFPIQLNKSHFSNLKHAVSWALQQSQTALILYDIHVNNLSVAWIGHWHCTKLTPKVSCTKKKYTYNTLGIFTYFTLSLSPNFVHALISITKDATREPSARGWVSNWSLKCTNVSVNFFCASVSVTVLDVSILPFSHFFNETKCSLPTKKMIGMTLTRMCDQLPSALCEQVRVLNHFCYQPFCWQKRRTFSTRHVMKICYANLVATCHFARTACVLEDHTSLKTTLYRYEMLLWWWTLRQLYLLILFAISRLLSCIYASCTAYWGRRLWAAFCLRPPEVCWQYGTIYLLYKWTLCKRIWKSCLIWERNFKVAVKDTKLGFSVTRPSYVLYASFWWCTVATRRGIFYRACSEDMLIHRSFSIFWRLTVRYQLECKFDKELYNIEGKQAVAFELI